MMAGEARGALGVVIRLLCGPSFAVELSTRFDVLDLTERGRLDDENAFIERENGLIFCEQRG